ncbi:MAG TPA: pyridoxal phosphate-dependent aminotransferase [Spirochaetia bacterium]|nr:pyridoxal phosphate-dependent aminotransferase [Spirochaetia bacterium]
MRRNLVHSGATQLKYEIRQIVLFAQEIARRGVPITWENIGDPIQKGETLPAWIKEIVAENAGSDTSYSYVDTQGIPDTRSFLAGLVNDRHGAQLTPADIIFFNGLGDAVSTIFGSLRREARVLGPSPAYSTLSSAEAAHSGYEHLSYRLDPENDWLPDIEDVELKIRYNDSIAGLLLINPDNPTGAVYPREVLQEFVRIARTYDIFLLCDETYANITYNGAEYVSLSQVIGDVPGISLRSISKDLPWPGARCGWAEVFNQHRDDNFRSYVRSIVDAKRLEVCSTGLPQSVIPRVFSDPRFSQHLARRRAMFEQRANETYEAFCSIPGIRVTRPRGALYFTVVFEEGTLNDSQRLQVGSPDLERFIETSTREVAPDKRFVYWLLAATGICVVPLSGFASDLCGFRMTLLETDNQKRRWIHRTIAAAITEYLSSGPACKVADGEVPAHAAIRTNAGVVYYPA